MPPNHVGNSVFDIDDRNKCVCINLPIASVTAKHIPLANHILGYVLAKEIRLHHKYNLSLSIPSQIGANLIYVIENICQNQII